LEKNKDQAVRFTALIIEAKEYYKLHLEEVVQWCSDFLKVPYETLLTSASGITIHTVEEYKKAISDKTIEGYYKSQQDNFLAGGQIKELVPVSDYVRFDIMGEAFKLIDSKKK
ncbi:MAG: taurine ABC transporter substrate-binding protein, partial [Clostridia bacterium]